MDASIPALPDPLVSARRWAAGLTAIGGALWLTGVGVLWIVGGVALFRTVRGEAGPGHTPTVLTFAGDTCIAECTDEDQQKEIYDLLTERGVACRVLNL